MDEACFDRWTRTLASGTSRRRTLGGLLGGALALLGFADPEDAEAGAGCKPACG